MTTAATAANSVDATTVLLQEELPQLEKHQQALQEELAVVSERLESVRGALTALSALSATTVPQPRAAEAEAPTGGGEASASSEPAADTSPEPELATASALPADEPTVAPQKTATPSKARKTNADTTKRAAKPADKLAKRRPAAKPTLAKAAKKTKQSRSTTPSETVQDPGGLTEQVMAVLARNADVALRARDVAEALGRDDTTGNINTVRSTLDRLIATSRAHRAGRGLYQAPTA